MHSQIHSALYMENIPLTHATRAHIHRHHFIRKLPYTVAACAYIMHVCVLCAVQSTASNGVCSEYLDGRLYSAIFAHFVHLCAPSIRNIGHDSHFQLSDVTATIRSRIHHIPFSCFECLKVFLWQRERESVCVRARERKLAKEYVYIPPVHRNKKTQQKLFHRRKDKID